MNLKPVNNYILIKQLIEEKPLVDLPQGVVKHLQQWKVLATSPETTCCQTGDLILLRPGSNVLGTNDELHEGLTSNQSVLAVFDNPPVPLS